MQESPNAICLAKRAPQKVNIQCEGQLTLKGLIVMVHLIVSYVSLCVSLFFESRPVLMERYFIHYCGYLH